MSIRERARLGAVALGLGAAVLAAIQILEQTVTQFNPRPVVSALITVVVAAAGVTLARARSVAARGQFLARALAQWPMPTAVQADPLLLGVFPPREPGLPPYVPREADGALDRAFEQTGFVLVVGPARAGKSRTAYEALRRAFPEERVLVPVAGMLTSATGDVGLRSARAVWWLDDLERFLIELNQPVLTWLLDGGLTVLASIRSQAWNSLVQADGEAGEEGRRLLAGARVVHLVAQLTPDEQAEAERVYPGLDVSRGIGAALSADGDADNALTSIRNASALSSRRLDPMFGLALLATTALAALLLAPSSSGVSQNRRYRRSVPNWRTSSAWVTAAGRLLPTRT
jgi:hypothetical protein